MTQPGLPLELGDDGDGVRDLHQRLHRIGELAQLPDEVGSFSSGTVTAVRSFQERRGLRVDGVCTLATWNAIVEADCRFGERLLYLQRPMMRGDDVEELQLRLGGLGFDAGRVDGIFGPDTVRALSEFQRNVGVTVDGIFGAECLAAMNRIGGRAGDRTVAVVRAMERLRLSATGLDGKRIVVGDLDGQGLLSELLVRELRLADASVAHLTDPTESDHARHSNDFEADLYVGLELDDQRRCRIAHFSVPGYESYGGRHLSSLLVSPIERVFAAVPDFVVSATGMRLPVLRETRMPAIVVRIGPAAVVQANHQGIATALSTAITEWASTPPPQD